MDFTLLETGKYTNPMLDAPKLFRLLSCDNPALTQFEENLLRALNGQPPAQRRQTPIPGATEASDRGLLEGRYASVGEACFADGMFSENTNVGRLLLYCSCLERKLVSVLSPVDVVKYTANYELLEANDAHFRQTFSCRQ